MNPVSILTSDNLSLELALSRQLAGFFDPDWYQSRYPDIVAAKLDPLLHYLRYGAAEQRDPNKFFESAWYIEHYPDVAASGQNPLLHYLQAGAAELRNPNPTFDAAYYVDQHPEAAANPLLYHLRVGAARGFMTERLVDIRDYLPSTLPPLPAADTVMVDVIIIVGRNPEKARDCIESVLASQTARPGRIIVVDDCLRVPELAAWLNELQVQGRISLIQNRRHLGFAASVNLGIEASDQDVVLLSGDTRVPRDWLPRLAAHAYSQPNIATASPFLTSRPGSDQYENPAALDEICCAVNAGRSVNITLSATACMYIRRDAIRAIGLFGVDCADADGSIETEFCQRATAAGWRHRLACDMFASCSLPQPDAQDAAALDPFRFAVGAGLLRQSKLPVILMVSHNLGGGVRRHINSLVERYRDNAHMLLLEGTDRGAALSILSLPSQPVLTLPSDRLDDLITVLRSTNVSRLHIHHLLQMDMDIRALVSRMGLPFDVTVHDYFAICPQINLLMWSEGLYCEEPAPAVCNACIADRSSHGARDIVSWRRDRAWQFLDADRVICPSADVKARLERFGMAQRAVVVPHEQQLSPDWTIELPDFVAPPLRIVLLGVLANHKGARVVAEVAEAAAPGTIELHLIGHLEASFPQPAVRLIKTTGKYQDCDLPELLRQIRPHVFWFPSSCPETYSYTLTTAIETGLPIVATELGSFPERLAGRPHSWLVDHRSSAEVWLAAFDEVSATLRDAVVQPPAGRPLQISDFYGDRYLSPASRVKDAALGKKPKIAIVPERFDTGDLTPCAYIRLLQPLDHPLIAGDFDIILADVETIFGCHVDIIITQRHAIPDVATANRLADHARRTGAKLLFDLDDDLLHIPSSHPDASTLQPLAKTVRRMLTVADTVWVSTPGLAASLTTIRPGAVVVENGLDERIWIHATGPAPTPLWDDPVRILCMGTTSHTADFALIEPSLLRLKTEYGDRIVIDVLGMTGRSELPAGLNRIGPTTHASRSYPGFVNWLTSVQPRWHIGLAPLLDTAINQGKSPIKAMDYAALGLSVLASDTQVYRGSIADGPAGQLVANDPAAWHAALDWLIRHQDLRQSRAAQARQAFLARATLASQADARRAALSQELPGRTRSGSDGLHPASAALTILHGSTDPVTRKRRHSGRGR